MGQVDAARETMQQAFRRKDEAEQALRAAQTALVDAKRAVTEAMFQWACAEAYDNAGLNLTLLDAMRQIAKQRAQQKKAWNARKYGAPIEAYKVKPAKRRVAVSPSYADALVQVRDEPVSDDTDDERQLFARMPATRGWTL